MQFNFWSDWPQSLQKILLVFGSLFFISIIYTFYTDLRGVQNILDWQIIGQRTPQTFPILQLELGNLYVPLSVTNSLISETFIGGPVVVNQFANYFFLLILLGIIVLGTTSITYLPRIWYLISNMIFAALIWYLKLDQLVLFGLEDNTAFVLVTISYLGSGYYFTSLRQDKDFISRFSTIAGITILWIIVIGFFAEVEKPFQLIAANGFLVPYIIGLVFIMMVSHEILHFILVAISRPGVISGNNLTRFTLFSIIYLVNIILLLLFDTHVISWNLIYLNPYTLLGISSILGLWGLQTRKELFKSISHYPILVFMYIVMGLCCFGTIFYFLGNANDPILQVVKDVIIYSHFGFGIIFFIYVISNFMGILRNNMAVDKVVYKPRNMPHFTFRFAGVMIVLGFALKENIEVPVFQTISGQYNNLGDYHYQNGDLDNAKYAYEEGKIYGYMNHKSNYSLGKLYELEDTPKAVEHFSNAIQVRPSEMAFVNLSSLWSKTGDLFNSLFILNDGQEAFQKSMAILNNKGHLFTKLNIADSAILYFDAASRAGNSMVPVTNYLGLLAKRQYVMNTDSIIDHYNAASSYAARVNAFALKNLIPENEKIDSFEIDTMLSMYNTSFITNFFINQYQYIDPEILFRVNEIASKPTNSTYEEETRYHTAIALYLKGHVNRAIEILENLSAIYQDQAKYQFSLGVIRSELHDYELAKFHFSQAISEAFQDAELAWSICMYKSGEQDSARIVWENMIAENTNERKHLAEELLSVTGSNNLNSKTIFEKDLWIRMNTGVKVVNKEYIDQLTDTTGLNRDVTLTYLIAHYDRMGKTNLVDELLSKTSIHEFMNRERTLKYFQLKSSILLNQPVDLNDPGLTDDLKLLDKANKSANPGDSILFRSLSSINAFNIATIEKSVEFYRIHGEALDSYNVIIDALRINPNSIPLLKLYVKECLNQYLTSYALNGLKSLYQLVDEDEYNGFISENSDQLTIVFGEEANSMDR